MVNPGLRRVPPQAQVRRMEGLALSELVLSLAEGPVLSLVEGAEGEG